MNENEHEAGVFAPASSVPAEVWREVPDTDGFYEVSSTGSVRTWRKPGPGAHRLEVPRLLTAKLNVDGYPEYHLRRRANRWFVKAHVLVMLAFEGPRPPGAIIRHLNDVKTDNRVQNLTYGTPGENTADCVSSGRHPSVDGGPSRRLTSSEYRKVEQATGYQYVIAKEFGISQSHVSRIKNREVKHVDLEEARGGERIANTFAGQA